MRALQVLFGAGFTAATAWAMGRVALRRLKFALHREDEHLIAFIFGSALLSMCVFTLASLKLIYDATLLALGIGALVLAWKTGAYRSTDRRLPSLPRYWKWLFVAVSVPFAVVTLAYAMAPEMSPDGSSYHLGVMSRFYREHGFVAMPWQMYAQLSQGIDLLYLFAFAFGRHSAAATLHWLFLAAVSLLILRFGQRAGSPGAGAAAALFFFVSPVVQIDGASAYNDVALAAVIFALFYVLESARDAAQSGVAVVAGLLAGFCYGTKYTAFIAVPYALVRLVLIVRRHRTAFLRPVLVYSACVALMVLPWMTRNAVSYGNPVAPLMNRWFPNPVNHVSFEDDYARYMRKYIGLESYADLPLELTVRGKVLNGLLGPLFLLTPLALFALRSPVGRRVLAAALMFAAAYPLNVGTRFLIPALPFLSLGLALAMPPWRFVLPALVLVHAAASWYRAVPLYSDIYAWRITDFRGRAALTKRRADAFIAEKFPGYRAARMTEQMTPPDAVVLTFNPMAEAYTTRETRVWYQSAQGERLLDALWIATHIDAQPVRGERYVFPERKVRKVRVIQSASHDDLRWSIGELRVKRGDAELARDPGWRITASHYPWDVPLAFDNLGLTRWQSWQKLEPGMFVEIDFGKAEAVSEVLVEMSGDQWSVKMHVEGMGDDGQWRVLAQESTRIGRPPELEMRQAAIAELKRAGVTHMFVSEGEFGWDDFKAKPHLWNIKLVGEVDQSRLYRLE